MKDRVVSLFRPDSNQDRIRRAFLPAALEVTETPAAPLGRIVLWVICLMTVLALIGSYFGKIDIVAVAAGKTIASSKTKLIQPLEIGTVKAIHVRAGQHVRENDPLIDCDSTAVDAEISHAKQDLVQSALDEIRLKSVLHLASIESSEAIPFASPSDIERNKAYFRSQIAEYAAKSESLEQEIRQHTAELAIAKDMLAKAETVIPLVAERAEIRRKGALSEYGSRLLSLEAAQQLVEAEHESATQKMKIDMAVAVISGLKAQKEQYQAEFSKTALNDLQRASAQVSAATESLAKAARRRELLSLKSPISGTVQQVTVSTIGGVVTPSQQLMSIVPDQDPLEIEAVLPNREVGFVKPGQSVEVKVDAFPFTRFGLLRGKIVSVAHDSEPPSSNRTEEGSNRVADQSSNLEGSERLLYTVRIALESASITVDGEETALQPGMSVKAEIRTGERRIIGFLLSPISEYSHESLKER